MGANQSCETVERVTEVADFDFRKEEETEDNDKSWKHKYHKSWSFEHTQITELAFIPHKKQTLIES